MWGTFSVLIWPVRISICLQKIWFEAVRIKSSFSSLSVLSVHVSQLIYFRACIRVFTRVRALCLHVCTCQSLTCRHEAPASGWAEICLRDLSPSLTVTWCLPPPRAYRCPGDGLDSCLGLSGRCRKQPVARTLATVCVFLDVRVLFSRIILLSMVE